MAPVDAIDVALAQRRVDMTVRIERQVDDRVDVIVQSMFCAAWTWPRIPLRT